MASKLTRWINAKLKSKGLGVKEAKKDAGKYSSIAAAKRAGSLYYTDKKGRVMIAAYAEDLKTAPPPPKKRPKASTKSNRKAERELSIAKTRIKLADSESRTKQALAKSEKTKQRIKELDAELAKLDNKTDTKSVAKKRSLKDKLSGNADATTLIIIEGPKGPLKRKADATDNEVSNEQLKQKGTPFMESGDRYRQPGQGSGRGLRGTQPEEFTKKVKYKTRKAKGGLIDMRKTGLFK